MEILILIITLIGIIYGANNLVDGSSMLARRFNISDFIIGALIIGVGTSMPELVVSLIGTLNNSPDIAIGNVVGSNIFNILGILGLTAIIFPIPIKKENVYFDITFCILFSVILTGLALSSKLGLNLYTGLLLLLLFLIYTCLSFKQTINENKLEINLEPVWQSIIKIIGGLSILILSCDFFVDNAVIIARNLGLSEATISLTLIACGTSLPELAASMIAAFKKNTQIALGNIIGSNIFNISFIIGMCALVSPLSSNEIGIIDYSVMISAVLITFLCGIFGKINRIIGILMFMFFMIYTSYLII